MEQKWHDSTFKSLYQGFLDKTQQIFKSEVKLSFVTFENYKDCFETSEIKQNA